MRVTSPGPTLGVVGGGQLGRMLGEAAAPLGVEVVVADPTEDPPATPVTRDQLVGGFDDPATVRALAERADYLTYEIELADADVLETVSEETGVPVHPAPETLRTTQDKLREKRRLADSGIPVPEFRAVGGDDADLTAGALRSALDDLGYPAMVKAREGGYDGRGNVPVESPEDVERAVEALDGPALVEELLDFERELAVVGARGDGETATFPVTETVHEEEILRETLSPARIDPAVRREAREVATDVLDVLSGRGVFGIELFLADGEVLVNEIAPRPHNSGHWTIEGALTSQFEQHARAVAGLPLGATDRRCPTVTANVLGDVEAPRPAALAGVEAVLSTPAANFHWYGKREVRPLRKMGHLTVLETGATAKSGVEELLVRARALTNDLHFES